MIQFRFIKLLFFCFSFLHCFHHCSIFEHHFFLSTSAMDAFEHFILLSCLSGFYFMFSTKLLIHLQLSFHFPPIIVFYLFIFPFSYFPSIFLHFHFFSLVLSCICANLMLSLLAQKKTGFLFKMTESHTYHKCFVLLSKKKNYMFCLLLLVNPNVPVFWKFAT